MKTERIRKLGKAIILLSLAMMATSFLYFALSGQQLKPEDQLFATILFIFSLLYFPLAWLIVSRTPYNTIGWLFVASIAAFSIQMFAFFLRDSFGVQGVILLPLGNLWVFGLLNPISFMLLYFPDGRLLSHRWRLALFANVLGMLGIYSSITLDGSPYLANYAWAEGLLVALQIVLLFGLLGSLASVILRYRRSKGIIRAQIRWVAFTAAIALFVLLISILTGLVEQVFGLLFFFSPPILIALAIGVSVLRYRLFDIDIIIRRTLQYAILTVVLGLIYFGGIVLLQNIFSGLFGATESPLITVISTLTIAALFNPLRSRIQVFIDRRFFRSKYDAEKALTDFAAVARDEVDMVRLSGSLLSVVENTMQPEQTSLWLRGKAREEIELFVQQPMSSQIRQDIGQRVSTIKNRSAFNSGG